VADEASLLMNELASREDGEVGDAADVVARGKLSVLVGVNLEDNCLPGEIGGCAGDFRRGHAAWATPLGPEVDEDGHAGVLDHIVKKFDICSKGFIDRRQRILAGSAAACVC
jgi:hypothetical protein